MMTHTHREIAENTVTYEICQMKLLVERPSGQQHRGCQRVKILLSYSFMQDERIYLPGLGIGGSI